MLRLSTLAALFLLLGSQHKHAFASAFLAPAPATTSCTTACTRSSRQARLHMSSSGESEYLQKMSSEKPEITAEPKMNPDRPELPAIPGDYDWDAKYEGDDDWVTGPDVPGKKVLNEVELAQQVTALGGLEEKWRRERELREYEESINGEPRRLSSALFAPEDRAGRVLVYGFLFLVT